MLVSIGLIAPIEPSEFMLGADYVEWRAAQTPFEALTSWSGVTDCDLTEDNAVRLRCAQVESSFLPAFGIRPLIGRNFSREEDRPNAPRVAILSHAFWRSRFGGDWNITGRTIQLDGQAVRVIGVLPPQFELPTLAPADLLLPQALDEAAQRRPNTGRVLRSFARLKPGVSIDQARAQMEPLFQRSLQFAPAPFRSEVKLSVRSLQDRQISHARWSSWVILGAVLAVLLIACANVAGLMLARAASRERELAVRAALGAGRGRLIRDAFTQSLILAGLGGVAGCFFASSLLRVFISIAPSGIPRIEQASLDPRVLCFAIICSIGASVLFGLAPALQGGRVGLLNMSRTTGWSPKLLRHILVAGQIAVSIVLLCGAALLMRSLWNLQRVPLGVTTDRVFTAPLVFGRARYGQTAQVQTFVQELETRVHQIPGVAGYAISDSLPPSGQSRAMIYSLIHVEGTPAAESGTGGMVGWRVISPGYFSTLKIPILRGRAFSEEDQRLDSRTMILSEALARRLFPADDPLGAHIRPGREGDYLTVIGIAADVRNNGLTAPIESEYYLPMKHADQFGLQGRMPPDAFRRVNVTVRSSFEGSATAEWLRDEIHRIDSSLPVTVEAFEQRYVRLTRTPLFNAMLLGFFAATGLTLAAIGLYGLITFLVTQRTREIGVRVALGATPAATRSLVLSHVFRWTAAGVIAGLAGTLVLTRSLRTLLFEVQERDPLVLVISTVVLTTVALAAAWLPARRAARVDPSIALRYE
jgi:predicted permease